MLPQDRSRTAVLDLSPLPTGGGRLAINQARLREVGSLIRGRIAGRWRQALAAIERYQDELMASPSPGERPFDARGADLFGTMLGLAEVLLFDDREDRDAEALGWVDEVRRLATADADPEAAEAAVLQHLLSSLLDPYRSGARTTVALWLRRAAGLDLEWNGEPSEARKVIGAYGLLIVPERPPEPAYLAIANSHQGLAGLYQGTPWAATPGAQPVWVQALRRLAVAWGGIEYSGAKYFGGVTSRAVLLPFAIACPDPVDDKQLFAAHGP